MYIKVWKKGVEDAREGEGRGGGGGAGYVPLALSLKEYTHATART